MATPIVIDETSGVQALTNEISFTSGTLTTLIPSGSQLFGISGVTTSDVTNVAKSSSTVISFSTPVSSASLTIKDTDANPGVDSGLTDLNGNHIFFYPAAGTSGSNDFLFVARVGTGTTPNPTGEVALVLVYEGIENSSNQITGFNLYTLLFDVPIEHPNTNDPNDAVSITSLIDVTFSTLLVFDDFSNAPPGQNAYIGLDDPRTGTADQNQDILFTSGTPGVNRVNTSKQGIAVDNQGINPGELIRADFVSNLNLAADSKQLSTLSYDQHYLVSSAEFFISQTTPTGTRVNTQVEIFDATDLKGSNFANLTATQVNLQTIQVFNASGVKIFEGSADGTSTVDPQLSVDFVDANTVNIIGLANGYRVSVTGVSNIDRIEIKNIGQNTFDLGGVSATIGSSSNLNNQPIPVDIRDDGPSITVNVLAAADALTVDETNLGNNDSKNFADNFSSSPLYGTDGAGSVTSAYTLSVKSANVASGLVDVATDQSVLLSVNGSGVVEGRTATSNVLVFTVSVDSAGLVTLDQIRALKHPITTNPDDVVTLSAADLIKLTRTDTIIDGDEDDNTGSNFINIGQALNFKDDGPSITVNVVAAADALTVDETNLSNDDSKNFADNFSSSPLYGADGAGTVTSTYALSVKSANVASGLVDVATDQNVLLSVNGSGVVEGRTATSNVLVFTVSVNSAGLVTLDQIRALKHPIATNPDDVVTLSAADLIKLTRTDTITDKDGDTNTGSNFINIGQALNFKDDGPSLGPIDSKIVGFTTNTSVTGNLNLNAGADGLGSLTILDVPDPFTLVDGRTVTSTIVSGKVVGTDSTGASFYELSFNPTGGSTGQYTFTMLQSPPIVVNPIDFSSVKAGGPKETLTVENVTFDGFSLANNNIDSNFLTNRIDSPTNSDDVNPNNAGGIGVGNGNIEQKEGLLIDVSQSPDPITGIQFDVTGVGGGIGFVDFYYEAYKNDVLVTSGNIANVNLGDPGTDQITIETGLEFDDLYIVPKRLDSNDAFRINQISTLSRQANPDYQLSFGIRVNDRDLDPTLQQNFTVGIDSNLDSLITSPVIA